MDMDNDMQNGGNVQLSSFSSYLPSPMSCCCTSNRKYSVQLRPGAQNENNPQQRAWERGVWDLVFHSYYGNLTRDNVCG